MLKSLKIALFLSFVLLMGQQSCSPTTPNTKRSAKKSRSNPFGKGIGGKKAKKAPPKTGHISCVNPSTDFDCMMCNCGREAGNQRAAGKLAVGKVVMTRVGMDTYPNTLCGNIKKKARNKRTGKITCQFSWFCKKDKYRPIKGTEYQQCYGPTMEALAFRGHFASHYHANYVKPRWRKNCRGAKVVQSHIFYDLCDRRRRANPAQQENRATAMNEFYKVIFGDSYESL